MIRIENGSLEFLLGNNFIRRTGEKLEKHVYAIIIFALSAVSILAFLVFYQNGLGLAYNDARSHLDIARRVVEGLKPGLAQPGRG